MGEKGPSKMTLGRSHLWGHGDRWRIKKDEISWGQRLEEHHWFGLRKMPAYKGRRDKETQRDRYGEEIGWKFLRAKGSFKKWPIPSNFTEKLRRTKMHSMKNCSGNWDDTYNEKYPREWTGNAFLWPVMLPETDLLPTSKPCWRDVCVSILKKD